jgi:4-hydroxy-2-oxoheptanedioate aldolase
VPEIPRLNGVIRALEQGKTAFVGFAPADVETATALAGSSFDGVAFEMEHAPMSTPALRDTLQYMPGAPRSFAVLEQGRKLAGR